MLCLLPHVVKMILQVFVSGSGKRLCKCVYDTRPVKAHPLNAIQYLMLVHVASQDYGIGTPSRYVASQLAGLAVNQY